jgi:hypothetical protein
MKHHLARYAHAVDFTTQPAEYFAYHDLLTGCQIVRRSARI